MGRASTPLLRYSALSFYNSAVTAQEPEWKATELYVYPGPANLAAGANPSAMEPTPVGSAGRSARHAAIG